MALITFANKNRLAAEGSHEAETRDDDINELKDGILTLENFLVGSGNTVIVDTKSDFPTPVAGVITLVSGTVYRIVGAINIGVDRIDTNGAFILGAVSSPSIFASTITYTGTGIMFTCTANDFVTSGVTFICATGTFISFATGGGTKLLSIHHSIINCVTLGTIENPFIFFIRLTQMTSSTGGFTLSGANIDAINIENCGCDGVSGTVFDFGTSVTIQTRISGVDSTLGNGEFFVSGLAAGANFSTALLMMHCSFKLSGTGAVFENITVNDTNVHTNANAGLQDTKHDAAIYIADGDETDTIIGGGSGDAGNPIVILGTFTEDHANRFTTNAAGRITYHNGQEAGHFSITAIFNGAPSSGSNVTYACYISVMGTISLLSRDKKTASSGAPQKMILSTEVDLDDGDWFEIWVENLTNTTNFATNSVKLLVD